ncbi:hypothetical protein [Nannocystis radixulma]|uniref:Right handed beta helix domain-containing protein n=1 Tax=Nannocystis radixulma TaxID=2995305 RepID=A0ABT5BM39_9BACT|nr:hypothetical protein [Nannocystis radixulma]MDC0675162.1 hypothetical protein [Nannocystis radixulma]
MITAHGLIGSVLSFACFSPTGQTSATTAEASGDASTTLGTTIEPTAGPTSDGTTGEPPVTVTSIDPTADTLTPTTGSSDCGQCPDSAPYCAPDGQCVDCLGLVAQGASCHDVTPGLPICDPGGLCVGCLLPTDCSTGICDLESKQCVECNLSADCPDNVACDPDTHTCMRCREHSDCPDSACELDLGSCFPKDTKHWYVDVKTAGCQGTVCSLDTPCCEIQQAFTALAPAPGDYHVVHVEGGEYSVPVRLEIAKRVALLAGPKTQMLAAVAGQPSVRVGTGGPGIDAKLYIAGLQFSGLGDVAVNCAQATVAWLDDVTVSTFVGNSLYATGCATTIRRSRFIGNLGGLTANAAGQIHLENSIVSGITTGASLLVQGGALDLDYSTVTLQDPVPGGLLYCIGGSAAIRNSVVVSDEDGDQVECNAILTAATSVTSETELASNNGVVIIPSDTVAEQFVGYAAHDLRPAQESALAGVAVWEAEDPPTDIDRLARPNTPGSPDFAGAHVLE